MDKLIRIFWVTFSVLLLPLVSASPTRGQSSDDTPPALTTPDAPAEMDRLRFLLGRWDNRTEFLGPDGAVVRTFHLAQDLPGAAHGYVIQESLGGWTFEGGVGSAFGRSWYRYDPDRALYQLFASDAFGNLDVLEGGFEAGELVLTEPTSEPSPQGGTIRWRWVFAGITATSYRIRQYASRDEGRTWVQVNRQVQSRLPRSTPEGGAGQNFMRELSPWIGSWQSTPDSTADGRHFRFHLDLEWSDPNQSLIDYSIHQAFEDGERRLLWEGTKGFDPHRGVTFSDQRSPNGLVGRGVYERGPDATLVVHSKGFSSRGPIQPIRDVFEPHVGERAFRTETHMFLDGEWQMTGADEWRPRDARVIPPDSLRAAGAIGRLVGAWSVQAVGRDEPTGRLDVTWSENNHTLRKRMSLLRGPSAGVAAEGIIGFDPATQTLKGLDFQSMIWPEDRLVHLMFSSEYRVSGDSIQRLYTVSYPPREPLMPSKDRGGTTREFRETYRFVTDDLIQWTTEIREEGEWKPFGGAGAGSELRRIAG